MVAELVVVRLVVLRLVRWLVDDKRQLTVVLTCT